MENESKIVDALTTLVEKATGKNLKARTDWTKIKRDDGMGPCEPGYAVMSDRNGNGMQTVELFYIAESGRGAMCMPCEGRNRGGMVVGSLYPQVKGGELVVHQYTPYPKMRDDGVPHISGQVIYPHQSNPGGWSVQGDTYYSKSSAKAAEMLAAAKAAAAPKPAPVKEVSK